MSDVFNFYVYDDRSIKFEIAEPILLEDKNVTQFRFRIPKSLNGFDMTGWAWWFVYVNALGTKYSVPLTLADDEDDPDNYSTATFTVNYGMSEKSGKVSFAIEVIDANTGGDILHEWHTKTYTTTVEETLQGNQVEYAEDESDIISALIQQVQALVAQGGLDATGVTSGYVPTADGNDGWSWQAQQGGGGGGSVTVDTALSATSTNPVQNKVITAALNDKADSADLAAVATSGSYNDLSNKPTIPTVPVQSVNGKTGEVVLDADDVGAAPAITEVTVTTAGAVSQALDPGKIYHFTGALSSLTITLNAAEAGEVAQYHFDFISQSTAVTLTLPSTVVMPASFSVEANTMNEIDILNGYGVAQNWAVSANG